MSTDHASPIIRATSLISFVTRGEPVVLFAKGLVVTFVLWGVVL